MGFDPFLVELEAENRCEEVGFDLFFLFFWLIVVVSWWVLILIGLAFLVAVLQGTLVEANGRR